jgi:hypothetical protein
MARENSRKVLIRFPFDGCCCAWIQEIESGAVIAGNVLDPDCREQGLNISSA